MILHMIITATQSYVTWKNIEDSKKDNVIYIAWGTRMRAAAPRTVMIQSL